eukprot:2656154-Pyramimonas_sp.AAC.2
MIGTNALAYVGDHPPRSLAEIQPSPPGAVGFRRWPRALTSGLQALGKLVPAVKGEGKGPRRLNERLFECHVGVRNLRPPTWVWHDIGIIIAVWSAISWYPSVSTDAGLSSFGRLACCSGSDASSASAAGASGGGALLVWRVIAMMPSFGCEGGGESSGGSANRLGAAPSDPSSGGRGSVDSCGIALALAIGLMSRCVGGDMASRLRHAPLEPILSQARCGRCIARRAHRITSIILPPFPTIILANGAARGPLLYTAS